MSRSSSSASLLQLSDVDCFYGELQVLRKADLHIDPGEVVALFGPNGHGKSTLLKAISGINPPRSGSILFDGVISPAQGATASLRWDWPIFPKPEIFSTR
jgi:ABC-type sugar transport system ATPase subunit